MYKLFSYGELQEREIQKIIFGEEIKSYEGYIEDYCLNIANNSQNIVYCKNKKVYGKILCLTEEQIIIADRWNKTPIYIKTYFKVKTDIGEEQVLVYTKLNKDLNIVLSDTKNPRLLKPNTIEKAKKFASIQNYNIPCSDIYLFYPIIVERNNGKTTIMKKHIANNFYNNLISMTIKNELVYELSESLEINVSDIVAIEIEENIEVLANLYCISDKNGVGVFIISINNSGIDPIKIYEKAYNDELFINKFPIKEYLLKEYDFTKLAKPKFTIYSSGEWTNEMLNNTLEPLNETVEEEEDKYISKYFKTGENEYTKIYIGKQGLVQIDDNYMLFYKDRASTQILTNIIISSYVFQNALNYFIKNKINEFSILCENGNYNYEEYISIKNMNMNCFSADNYIYPIAKQRAMFISENLNVSKIRKSYIDNIERLEEVNKINVNNKDQIEIRSLSIIILLVAVLSTFTVFTKFISEVEDFGLDQIDTSSYIVAIFSCFIFFIIYRIYILVKKIRKKD